MTTPAGSLGEADVRIVADTSRFREEVEGAIASVGDAEVKVRPDMTGFRTAVNNMTKGMPPATVRVRCVSIGGNPCGGGGRRGGGGGGGGDNDLSGDRNSRRAVRNLNRIQEAFAFLGGIVGTKSAALGYALAALVVILAPLAGLVWAIPGAAAAAGAAFLLWQKRGDQLKKSLKGVQDAINDALNTKVGSAALDYAFKQVNRIITEFEKFFRTADGVQLVANSFKILGDLAGGFADAVAPVMKGLGDVVSNTLPLWERMGKAIGDAGKQFGQFLTNSSKGGDSSTAFQAMSDGMRAFGDVMQLIGSIVGVFSALFAPMADGIHVATDAISGLFDAIQPLVSGLGSIGGVLIETFGEGLKIITALLKPFMPLIGDLLKVLGDQLGKVLDALVPAFDPVIDAFKRVADSLKPMVDGPLTDLVKILGDFLADAITEVAPLLGDLADLWAELAVLIVPIVTEFMKLAISVLPYVVAAIIDVIRVVVQIISFIVRLVTAIVKVIHQFASWAKGSPAVRKGLQLVKGAISGVVSGLKTLWHWAGKAWDAIKSLGSSAKDLGKSLLNKIPGVNLASGGIIMGPTKALVGEAGPEVVLPLTRPQRAAELAERAGLMNILGRAGAASGGRMAPRDVSVHIHTAATSNDIIIHRMQRAMAAALAA